MRCPICGFKNDDDAIYCISCSHDLGANKFPPPMLNPGEAGSWPEQPYQSEQYHYHQPDSTSPKRGRNAFAVLGFVLSLLCFPSCFATLTDISLLAVAPFIAIMPLVFSIIALKSEKRGLAVTGLLISLIDLAMTGIDLALTGLTLLGSL